MTANICRMCHNTSFHYSPEQGAIVCDICGTPAESLNSPDDELNYQRSRSKAIAYIRANDYQSAIRHLDSMKDIKPDDPEIYYLHLMGLTSQTQDYLLSYSDYHKRSLGRFYWQILNHLTGDTSPFIYYGIRRKNTAVSTAETELNHIRRMMAICFIATVSCLVLSLLGALVMWMYLFVLPVAIPIYIVAKNRLVQEWISGEKKLKYYRESTDPFFEI